jgi:hypothetical protein
MVRTKTVEYKSGCHCYSSPPHTGFKTSLMNELFMVNGIVGRIGT